MRSMPDGSFAVTAEPEAGPAATPDPDLLDLDVLTVRTLPGPMGPTVRYRVLGEDGESRMQASALTSHLRFGRGVIQTDAGLLVLAMRSHNRDHGPSYLFPDAELTEETESRRRAMDERRTDRLARTRELESVDPAAVVLAATGTKGGTGTGEASAVSDDAIDPDPARPCDDTVDSEPHPDEVDR